MTIRAMGDDRPWEMIAREVIIRAIFRGQPTTPGVIPRPSIWGACTTARKYYHLRSAFDGRWSLDEELLKANSGPAPTS